MKQNEQLRAAFRFWRQQGSTAAAAIERARADVAAGKARYPTSAAILGAPFEAYRGQLLRWCERPADVGLRLVGFADEIWRAEGARRRMDHTGWYTDDDGTREKLRGVVYQFPARDGCALYVCGYADPNSDGAAALDFAYVWRSTLDDSQARIDAAAGADHIAEHAAEAERDYNRAWDAGRMFADLGEEAAALRKDTRETIAAYRGADKLPAKLCEVLRANLQGTLARLESIRKDRAQLRSGEGLPDSRRDRYSYWDTRNAAQREAFADGSGLSVAAI